MSLNLALAALVPLFAATALPAPPAQDAAPPARFAIDCTLETPGGAPNRGMYMVLDEARSEVVVGPELTLPASFTPEAVVWVAQIPGGPSGGIEHRFDRASSEVAITGLDGSRRVLLLVGRCTVER